MSSELTHNLGQFDEVIHIIDNARSRAMKAVNAELIQMYWSVGAYLSELCSASSFGDKIIDEVAAYIAQENPNIKGFNRRGLYRMKQFYETYKDDEFVTPLVTQISWTNHLLIMSGSKTAEERHFYMALCAKEHYSKRELERQIGTSYYERSMISAKKPMPESVSHDVRESILDTYVLEFLDLPEQFSEKNLRKAIIENLKQFILEFGRDFTFIGAMLSMGLILLISQRVNQMSLLVVCGVMIGYICSALTDFLVTFADDSNIVNLHNWSNGSFSGMKWENVTTMAWACGTALILTFFLSKPIRAYQLGEVYARNMGVPIKAFRAALILLSSVLSACVTAFAGPISFVGIALPHLMKALFKTAEPLLLIPASFLGGGIFCLACDLIARTAFAPTEVSISSVTAVFGAPVVIYMMVRRKAGRE